MHLMDFQDGSLSQRFAACILCPKISGQVVEPAAVLGRIHAFPGLMRGATESWPPKKMQVKFFKTQLYITTPVHMASLAQCQARWFNVRLAVVGRLFVTVSKKP